MMEKGPDECKITQMAKRSAFLISLYFTSGGVTMMMRKRRQEAG